MLSRDSKIFLIGWLLMAALCVIGVAVPTVLLRWSEHFSDRSITGFALYMGAFAVMGSVLLLVWRIADGQFETWIEKHFPKPPSTH